MKRLLAASLLIFLTLSALHAGEQGLTRTVQPLDDFAAGELLLAPVMCWDRNVLSTLPTGIAFITAKNIPPTNSTQPVDDANVASVCGLVLSYDEDEKQNGIVTLDCRALQVPPRFGCTEQEIVGATLECLRQVEGVKLDKMTLKTSLNPKGQEWIQKMMEKFIKHPKDKEFPWKGPER